MVLNLLNHTKIVIMKNSNDLARKFAKLYGIEIIEAPNSHQFIKDNDVVSFNDRLFWDAFCIPLFDSLPYNHSDNIPIIEETTGFTAKRVAEVCFKTNEQFSNDVIHSENYQYAMAA